MRPSGPGGQNANGPRGPQDETRCARAGPRGIFPVPRARIDLSGARIRITVHYFEADDAAPRLSDFTLTTVTGTTLPGLRGFRFRPEARAVAADAERILAPRLVPAMAAAYESGAAVSFGRVQVSRAGIEVSGWGPPGEPVPWPQVKSVHVTYIRKKDGNYAHEVIVGGKGLPTTEIGVSGLPNGIFLPRLLAFAADRKGIMVTGYREDGGGGPAG